MKRVWYILLWITFANCAMFRHSLPSYDDVQHEFQNFTDSLLNNGVDTMIAYYKGPAGCFGSKEAYVFWVHNGVSAITKYACISKMRKSKVYSRVDLKTEYYPWLPDLPPYRFLKKAVDKISTERMVIDTAQKPTMTIDYQFERMRIVVGYVKIDYDVADYQRRDNQLSYKVVFIDKFRSFLLEY